MSLHCFDLMHTVIMEFYYTHFLLCLTDGCYLLANNNEQIQAAIKKGDRPPLDAITGPADLLSFARKWIAKCWHKSPGERPSFDG